MSVSRNYYHTRISSPIGLIQSLLFAHLILLVFQIPIRAMIVDTTYIRDFLVFGLTGCLFILLATSQGYDLKWRISLLDKSIILYLFYGMFLVVFWTTSGVEIVTALRDFRNHFFPLILFFVSKISLSSPVSRMKLINLFWLIFIIIVINVLLEYIFLGFLGFSKQILPWYRYMFENSYYFYGNIVSIEGAIIKPEFSPILGIIGWHYSTAVVLLGLFAFNYPFILQNKHNPIIRKSSLRVKNLPVWFSYLIVFTTAVILLLILKVKMQIIIFAFLLVLGPIFIKGKYLGRNLLIFSIIVIIVLTNNFVYNIAKDLFVRAFINQSNEYSTIYHILQVNPIYAVFSQPLFNLLFGTWNYTGGSELRLLNYTLKYGLIWLFLFSGIIVWGITYAKKLMRCYHSQTIEHLFSIGTIYLLLAYFIDTGHYARILFAPNIDIVAVCLGTLSAIKTKNILHSKGDVL